MLTQHGSARTGKGRADLIIPLLCLEVKNARGHASPEQVTWLNRARRLGVPAYLIRSIDDARAAVALTRKGYVPMPSSDDLDLSFLDELSNTSVKDPVPAMQEPPPPDVPLTLDGLLAGASFESATVYVEAEPAVEILPEPEPEPQQMASEFPNTEPEIHPPAEDMILDQQRKVIAEVANTYGHLGTLFIKMAGLIRQFYDIDVNEASAPEATPASVPRKRASRAKTTEASS